MMDNDRVWLVVRGSDGPSRLDVVTMSTSEVEARVLSLARELLVSCKALLEVVEGEGCNMLQREVEDACAVIALAEGR